MPKAAAIVARQSSAREPIRMIHKSLPPEHDGIITTDEDGTRYQWFGLGWAAFERAAEICKAELAGGAA